MSHPPTNGGRNGRNFREYQVIGAGAAVMCLSWLLGYGSDPSNNAINLIMLFGSLVLLLAASNIVLEFSVKLAEAAGVSELVIGLTIVSVGTSIPEIFTSIISALNDQGGFTVGDIYGSYMTQLTIFLAIVVITAPRTVQRTFVPHIKRDAGLMIAALCVMSLNILDGMIFRLESAISVSIFIAYTVYLYKMTKKDPVKQVEQIVATESLEELEGVHTKREMREIIETKDITGKIDIVPLRIEHPRSRIALYIVLVLVGTLFCFLGAHFMVESGVFMAESWDVPEHVIASTIVGMGTGLPELVVSVMAVRKRRYSIAYGNLLGSNVVDPLLSISLGVFAKEVDMGIAVANQIIISTLPVALITGFFIIIMFSRHSTSKLQGRVFGVALLAIYAFYLLLSFSIPV